MGVGRSQAAHQDFGKGVGLKTDDRTCMPLCGPETLARVPRPGCHALVGSSGTYPKATRRDFERLGAHDTRIALMQRAQRDPVLAALLAKIELSKFHEAAKCEQ